MMHLGVKELIGLSQMILSTLLLHSHIVSASEPFVIRGANSKPLSVNDIFARFFTVVAHQILRARNIYPARTSIYDKRVRLHIKP